MNLDVQIKNTAPLKNNLTLKTNPDNKGFEINMKKMKHRIALDKGSKFIFSLSTLVSLVVLGILIYRISIQSIGWLDMDFLTSNLSIFPEKAGIKGAILGTLYLMSIVIPVVCILGVSTAIYLEEYANKGKIQSFIKVNISNLASVPSVIFGLLGLAVFGRIFSLGSSILAGGLTMSLLVLPVVVVASQEALRAVPGYLREASYAMGASKWTTTWKVVLPVAVPGILTGVILSVSRAIGETAPLVVLGVPTLIMKLPTSIMDDFTAMPIQIYYWTLDTVLTKEYANLAAATIVVLLLVLFIMNFTAILIRNKFQRKF
ncbi:phosphate ABC transporter, permease protein [Acetoanaerobium sticklandii]|jgi:phosphate transport system permease protein|uniref:Phosphate transport system permease protein PstA n=1 Tax=Acetoanaerobium sticklandii (strain ATCC 12662 / DSM 519 / JCM 1433 / CCUG 9281 / NCIMB 10654 / HF) TaxID=499177 RepID=E3PWC4_ACESD|nr:phosphate ABC transporter permease PstA [Acetoanaerobium sticklandii]CBH20739.1 phosphate ABC transporter, permease protein [Acetoanaerobium sticklandii]